MKLIAALDSSVAEATRAYANKIAFGVDMFKIGLEFFTSHSQDDIAYLSQLRPLFIDLKLHDIPNTVLKAVQNLTKYNPYFITLHCSGGAVMLKQTVDWLNINAPDTHVLGVSVLTSLDERDLQALGYHQTVTETVHQYISLGIEAGVQHFVCSAHEAAALKATFPHIKLICPGIHLSQGQKHFDQKRSMTPEEAYKNGVDYIVIGRSLQQSPNPEQTLDALRQTLDKDVTGVPYGICSYQ